ncbi:MAG: hypothetical protein A3D65_05110 [Candidatus Lloydbacteria bacterium RIFCSPHIGHO2_02_FULL_50_13]|uniref:CMP/dCMP-type deaminase domain-containing protein n=1 Tax=Candidatus Lloydbacteria bacterium RIFCSPHIGHO2_02_FULL_50_13 TaxID=1798661 RepID=A0A1G2D4T1_9BACT|nr:MAG: hypothetical protein A3D65_05110 [Candidatus Lloydbacteria bacterium RIFCSPHIGHO2_02_FULL_50_13]
MDLWKELLCKAYEEATKSPDPSTQNGALVVGPNRYWKPELDPFTRDPISTLITNGLKIIGADCNRFPSGIEYTHERLHTPLKYIYVAHAEFGAIFSALHTSPLKDFPEFTIVCPWAACTGCAKTIITSGIRRLVRHKQAHLQSAGNTKWQEEITVADVMLREVGVEIIEYDGLVGAPPVLHSGKYWNP